MSINTRQRNIIIIVSLLAMLAVQFAALHMHVIANDDAQIKYTHSHIIEALAATYDPLLQNHAEEIDLQTPGVLAKLPFSIDALFLSVLVILGFISIFKPLVLSHNVSKPLRRYYFHFRPPLRAPPRFFI